jgi:N-acetylmuramic acid 6-phosphate (MurNAc-6-P) etherase
MEMDHIISVPFGGERTFLVHFALDAGRNEGRPDVGWSTNRDSALRLSVEQAIGVKAVLSLPRDAALHKVGA